MSKRRPIPKRMLKPFTGKTPKRYAPLRPLKPKIRVDAAGHEYIFERGRKLYLKRMPDVK